MFVFHENREKKLKTVCLVMTRGWRQRQEIKNEQTVLFCEILEPQDQKKYPSLKYAEESLKKCNKL